MKKLLAFGLLFSSVILISPALAISGIEDNSNCQFQLPYTMKELMGIRDYIKRSNGSSWRINAVNGCTNQTEGLKVTEIQEDRSAIYLQGYLQDTSGKVIWRQIVIAK